MTDQCMHCTVRGDIDACMKTPCSQHESWYAQRLKALAKQEHGGHEDEEKAAKGQFTTMVEPSIHAGSGEKIGFPHRGQKQEQGEPVGEVTCWTVKGNLKNHDFDYYGNLPDGTHLLYTTPQQFKFLGLTQEEFENDKGA